MRRANKVGLVALSAGLLFALAPILFARRDIMTLHSIVRENGGTTVPSHVLAAIVRTEDADFYRHPLLYPLLSAFGGDGHASLTAQLAKRVGSGRTLPRSIREVVASTFIEATQPKSTIARAYAETVYLGKAGGHPVFGVSNAARAYFGRTPSQLTTSQIVALCSAIRNPSAYSPAARSERAIKRRLQVLQAICDSREIRPAECRTAEAVIRRGAV